MTEGRPEVVALAHQEIEPLPDQRYEVGRRRAPAPCGRTATRRRRAWASCSEATLRGLPAPAACYVLSDRGIWLAFKSKGDLEIVVEGDRRLFNQYGIILVNPAKHAHVKRELGQLLIDWIISSEGQNAIKSYTVNSQQLLFPNAAPTG